MPTYTYSFGPSFVVNGVCSSVYVMPDKEPMYCDIGEEGPHKYHAAQRVAHEPAWYWTDSHGNAFNDPHVTERSPK